MTEHASSLTEVTSADQQARRWIVMFADGWQAPIDADALSDYFRPWLCADYRFSQPLSRGVGVGPVEFCERFARPLFSVVSDVHATVESWPRRDDTVFIELRLTATVGRRQVAVRACDRVRLIDGLAARRSA